MVHGWIREWKTFGVESRRLAWDAMRLSIGSGRWSKSDCLTKLALSALYLCYLARSVIFISSSVEFFHSSMLQLSLSPLNKMASTEFIPLTGWVE